MKNWLIVLILLPTIAYSAGMRYNQVTPESRDEGDSPIFLDVACDPSVWTTIVSSDTIRRSMFIQTDYAVENPVCLGTAPAGNKTTNCDTSFQGIIIGTAIPSLTVYTKNNWTCRTLGSPTVQTGFIHGYVGRDKRDYGDINENQ